MTSLILSNYINTTSENLLEKLGKNGINYTEYSEENLTILHNNYMQLNKTPLQKDCRSVIIDSTTRKIVCYSCPTPLNNKEAYNYITANPTAEKEVFMCYEGSFMSLFNYNNTWYIASRKCIHNTHNSINTGQIKMFMDVIYQDYSDFTKFTNLLDINKSYHFVLIHHMNENIINYTTLFGDNYMKLCFLFSRDSTHVECKSENRFETGSFLSNNIFLPHMILNFNFNNFMLFDFKFANFNNSLVNNNLTSEGIIIRINGNILKFQTQSYQFKKACGSNNNIYLGFIKLFQNNSLNAYFEHDNTFNKITSDMKSYDIIGTIDALFKVCSNELYNLFTSLYNMTDGSICQNSLYSILPQEYKTMLYYIRGIFMRNKKHHHITDFLTEKNVYNLLKSYDIVQLENYIRARLLMMSNMKLNTDTNTQLFTNSLYKCNNFYYLLSSLYTTKMFPNIGLDTVNNTRTHETTQDTIQYTTLETIQETTQDITLETTHDITLETTLETTQDTTLDITLDTTLDTTQDTTQDITLETPLETPQETLQEYSRRMIMYHSD